MSAASSRRPHHRLTLAVLALGTLAYSLAQTMVAPSLPEIERELGASTTTATWVLTAYLLGAAVATPIAGRLGDMFGKERLLLVAQGGFALGLLLAALAPSIELLIAARVIQAMGAASFPLAFGIVRDEFPPGKVAGAIGLLSATFGIGGSFGLVLAGVLVDALGYEWIFWAALVLAATAVVATRLFVPESPVKSPAPVDWAGAVLVSLALVCLLLGVSQGNAWGWGSAGVLGLFAGAAVLFAVWQRVELRIDEPLVDLRLMARRPLLATNVAGLLVTVGYFSAYILIPQFVQAPESTGYGFGASVTGAGLFLLPSALAMLVCGPVAGALGGRFGSKLPLLMGSVVTAAGFLFLAAVHAEPWAFYVAALCHGAGHGLVFAAMGNLAVELVEPTQTGISSGVNFIMRTIGAAVGGQVAAAVLVAYQLPATGLPSEHGFTVGFLVAAVGPLAAVLVALLIPGRTRRARLEPAPAPA